MAIQQLLKNLQKAPQGPCKVLGVHLASWLMIIPAIDGPVKHILLRSSHLLSSYPPTNQSSSGYPPQASTNKKTYSQHQSSVYKVLIYKYKILLYFFSFFSSFLPSLFSLSLSFSSFLSFLLSSFSCPSFFSASLLAILLFMRLWRATTERMSEAK